MMSFELRKSQEYLILRTTWGSLVEASGTFPTYAYFLKDETPPLE